MPWSATAQVVDLFITQHPNGTTTYIDQNGQMYLPFAPQELHLESEGIYNSNISIESGIIFASICLILIIIGGISSGLNVALLSIDAKKNELMLKLEEKEKLEQNDNINDPDPDLDNPDLDIDKVKEQELKLKMRKKIQPLIHDRHTLLVTLLVANASVMEALPIFLDKLVVSWLAVVISVTFVLIFGEILPQALFSTDPLKSGYKMYNIVIFMKWCLYPICKPIALILDILFGKEHKVQFSQKEISIIMMEINKHPDQQKVVEGALNIGGYTVMHSIIHWEDVVCLDANTKLDSNGLKSIYKTGRSRIPIYENQRNNIIGILLVKMLIICDPDPQLTLKEYLNINFKKIPAPSLVVKTTKLYDTINVFQDQKTHFAMVCEEKDYIGILGCWRDKKAINSDIKWIGIITLEDIMEDIIQEPIDDEFDLNQSRMLNDNQDNDNNENKSNWTDDPLFEESVYSRFSAKNLRTLRAKKIKIDMEEKRKYVKSLTVVNKEDQNKPLLSADYVAINT